MGDSTPSFLSHTDPPAAHPSTGSGRTEKSLIQQHWPLGSPEKLADRWRGRPQAKPSALPIRWPVLRNSHDRKTYGFSLTRKCGQKKMGSVTTKAIYKQQ